MTGRISAFESSEADPPLGVNGDCGIADMASVQNGLHSMRAVTATLGWIMRKKLGPAQRAEATVKVCAHTVKLAWVGATFRHGRRSDSSRVSLNRFDPDTILAQVIWKDSEIVWLAGPSARGGGRSRISSEKRAMATGNDIDECPGASNSQLVQWTP